MLHQKRRAFFAPANKRNLLEDMLGCWAQKKGEAESSFNHLNQGELRNSDRQVAIVVFSVNKQLAGFIRGWSDHPLFCLFPVWILIFPGESEKKKCCSRFAYLSRCRGKETFIHIHRDCPNPILENWNGNQNPSKMDGKSQFVMILLALVTKVLCTENLALTDEWISIAANPPSTRAEVAWFHIHVGFFHQKTANKEMSVSQDTYRFISQQPKTNS